MSTCLYPCAQGRTYAGAQFKLGPSCYRTCAPYLRLVQHRKMCANRCEAARGDMAACGDVCKYEHRSPYAHLDGDKNLKAKTCQWPEPDVSKQAKGPATEIRRFGFSRPAPPHTRPQPHQEGVWPLAWVRVEPTIFFLNTEVHAHTFSSARRLVY